MPPRKQSSEEIRAQARRYVADQERAQKQQKESMERESAERHQKNVEGFHKHMYDQMDKAERRDAFGVIRR